MGKVLMRNGWGRVEVIERVGGMEVGGVKIVEEKMVLIVVDVDDRMGLLV